MIVLIHHRHKRLDLILTQVFHGFIQLLQANFEIIPSLGHGQFLYNSLFISHAIFQEPR
jgi:hypothetical protein